MKTENTLSKIDGNLTYYIFTFSGLLLLILANDCGWAGVALAVALAFGPFQNKKFKELTIVQKFWILGQMGVAMVFIVLSVIQVINS